MAEGFGQTQYDLRFSLFRIPIQIHPFFWLIAIWFSPFSRSSSNEMRVWMVGLIAWVLAFLISFLVHELGHALILKKVFGASPWIGLYGFMGLTFHLPYYRRIPDRWGKILISFAGPAAGFLASALLLICFWLAGCHLDFSFISIGPIHLPFVYPIEVYFWRDSPLPYLYFSGWFVYAFVLMTFIWGFLNLLPIQPLDGGNILKEMFLIFSPRNGLIQSLWVSCICAGALCLISIQERLFFTAAFCGYFAFQNYQQIQFNSKRRF